MNKARTKSKVAAMAAILLAGTIAFPFVGDSFSASAAAQGLSADGKYYTDYETLDDAKEAAAVVAEEVASEGSTLLKNKNNALPMAGSEKVSVFGTGSDYMVGKTGDLLCPALESEGFHVNPLLHSYYDSIGTTYGTEVYNFNKNIENSFDLYNDAAIIVLSRGGGEGADIDTMTDEKTDGKFADGTEHTALGKDEDGNTYKHFLQLTDSEEALLEYVKAQGFKKIIYLINCSEIFELYDLENDDAVDSILWIGRPGEVGNNGVAKILSGKVNPSGKTVDTWYKDFTADPTWYNFGDNSQNGSSNRYIDAEGNNTNYYGIDYEEDIYVGYRYYETRGYEETAANNTSTWYEDNVVYPFGYGLSYTSYEYSNLSIKMDNGSALSGTISASLLESYKGHEATVESGTATITVTNTGDVAGKETVELYAHAPYTQGEIEKSHVVLIGFAKTDILKPGQSQTLEITFNFQDMASYDYTDANKNGNKGYELDYGTYTIYAVENSHGWADDNAQKVDFTITGDTTAKAANLKLDDYSGNEVTNLFSKENGMYYSLRDNSGKYQFNLSAEAGEKLLNRAEGLAKSMPEAPSKDDLTVCSSMLDSLSYFDNFKVDSTDTYADGKDHYTGCTTDYATDTSGDYTTSDYPWMAEAKEAETRMSANKWTQATEHESDNSDVIYKLSLMAGIDPYGTTALTAADTSVAAFQGKTGAEAWDIFMNQLTYQELVDICGRLQKSTLESVGKGAISGQDSSWNYASTFCFTCGCINTATWNMELAEEEGRIIGNLCLLSGNDTWWGNSVQTHRSPFGGRAFEYASEDGLLAGYMTGSRTLGATKLGVACYVKHVALNDQETNRNGQNLFAWVSEQAVREIYFKSPEIVAQYGQAAGVMGAFARIGRVSVNTNYQFITELYRTQWGCSTISFTTDMYSAMSACSPLDLIVRAGTDNVTTTTGSGTWDATADSGLTGVTGAVVIGEDTVSNIQWYTYRNRAMIHLWTCANTAIGDNGVDLAAVTNTTINVVRGVTTSITAVPGMTYADGTSVNKSAYTITSGETPSGLTFNSDGTLTGTPTEEGTYVLTVKATADGYVSKTVTITVNVVSPVTLTEVDGGVKVELSEDIVLGTKPTTSDTVGTSALTAATIKDVTGLPEGMTYDATTGIISGSYTGEEVTYQISVQFTTSTVASSWFSGLRVIDTNKTVTVDVTVGTPAEVVEVADFQVKVEDGYIMISNDAGETWTNVIAVADIKGADGADGTDGTNGTNGTDGTTPTIEINDDGYWVINGTVTDVKATAEGGGCSSSIAGTSVMAAMALVAVCAFVLLRKKKNNN